MADEKEAKGGGTAQGAAPGSGPGVTAASGPNTASTAQDKNAAGSPASAGSETADDSPRKRRSGVDRDRGLRTGSRNGGTTEEMAGELDALGVDVRLDNRTGNQRPVLPPYLKPQQVPGPEVGHFGEHDDEFASEFEDTVTGPPGEPVGMRSTGAHGRGGEDAVDESQPVTPEPK